MSLLHSRKPQRQGLRAVRTDFSPRAKPFPTLPLRSCCSRLSMKRPINYIHLLFARKAHKVHGISRNANSQVWIVLGVVHRIEKHFSIQHVHIHVITRNTEERVEDSTQISDPIFVNSS